MQDRIRAGRQKIDDLCRVWGKLPKSQIKDQMGYRVLSLELKWCNIVGEFLKKDTGECIFYPSVECGQMLKATFYCQNCGFYPGGI